MNGSGGKACSERRILAIQAETGLVPMLLNLPVTSVRPIVESMRGIISSHKSLINNFILTLKLKEAQNSKGTKYAICEIDPSSVTRLHPDSAPVMKAMRAAAKAILDSIPKSEFSEFVETVDTEVAGYDK